MPNRARKRRPPARRKPASLRNDVGVVPACWKFRGWLPPVRKFPEGRAPRPTLPSPVEDWSLLYVCRSPPWLMTGEARGRRCGGTSSM